MVTFPNAKINLGLNIISKRADGFHNLESCFYPIPWQDALEILPAKDFYFSSSGIEIPGSRESNLCVKVYELLRKRFSLPPVNIHLHKNIPIGAGLGGGSSDAAFLIQAIVNKFDLGLSDEEMIEYARQLGSDCAFFIKNKPVLAFERGDQFKEINVSLAGKVILIIYPNLHISTAEAYGSVVPKKSMIPVEEVLSVEIKDWKDNLINDFERSLFPKYPLLREIKEKLYDLGALYASMSGSGSAIFGIFPKQFGLDEGFSSGFRVFRSEL